MERWRGRVALVTGASVGIGAAISVELVRLGMKVVGCARDIGKIQKLAAECQSAGHPGVLVPFKCDLTKEEEILAMFAAIKKQHKGVDVCINNAGLGQPEPLLGTSLSSYFWCVSWLRLSVMERWRGRVALVTGASVGIGAAVAVELVRLGMKVVGCARDVGKIQKLAAECQSAGHPGVLVPFKCDLTKEEEILAMFAAIKEQHKGVDVCINNAGLAHPEVLLNGKTSAWKNMWDVNVLALCICAREAYQSMKERNVDDGHIININSVCGHQVFPNPDGHFYTATKYAVTALTEGLRQELRAENTHIRATSISPGFVKTEFAYRLYRDDSEKAAAVYTEHKSLEAKDLISVVTYVLSAPPHVQIGEILLESV